MNKIAPVSPTTAEAQEVASWGKSVDLVDEEEEQEVNDGIGNGTEARTQANYSNMIALQAPEAVGHVDKRLTDQYIKSSNFKDDQSKTCWNSRRLTFLVFMCVYLGILMLLLYANISYEQLPPNKYLQFESFAHKIGRISHIYFTSKDEDVSSKAGTNYQLLLNAKFCPPGDVCRYMDIPVNTSVTNYMLLVDRHAGALLCWVISLFCDVFVIGIHLYHPPHPKFSLTKKRYISITAHVMSGAAECITGAFVLFFDGRERVRLIVYMAFFSLVHVITAILQTPIVFGTRKIMIPSYVACVTLKLFCWVQLARAISDTTTTTMYDYVANGTLFERKRYNVMDAKSEAEMIAWFLALVLVHHVYVWCRVFVGIFKVTGFFRKEQYTVAIILAGSVCIPTALGFFGMAYCWVVIAIFQPIMRCYGRSTKHHEDELMMARELARNPIFTGVYAQHSLELFERVGIRTVASFKQKSRVAKIAMVFRMINLHDNVKLTIQEIRELIVNWGVPRDEAIEFAKKYHLEHYGYEITFQEFIDKLENIWQFGISCITEALQKIERFDKEWKLLNPESDGILPPLTIHHLFGFPHHVAKHKLHIEHLKEANLHKVMKTIRYDSFIGEPGDNYISGHTHTFK